MSAPAHKDRPWIPMVIVGAGMIAVWAIASSNSVTPPPSACEGNWRLCGSNEELVKTWHGWSHAKNQCQTAANATAKYGEPKWPWFAFTSYLDAISFVKEGRALLVEKDAQFQNGFGAMAHVRVVCSYDLVNDRVIDVGWSAKD